MGTMSVVLLITVLSLVNAQGYQRQTGGHQAYPHYHEFDYRRFGGYPVHMGNGQFRFLGDSSHLERHMAVDRRSENVATTQTHHSLSSPTPQENSYHRQRNQPKPSGLLPPKGLPYTKVILSPGDQTHFPKRGDTVEVWYTGKLTNGEVFDSNLPDKTNREVTESKPLKFPVGTGLVIRGWDESLLTMSVGEKARVTIQPEWGYGAKGAGGGKIPPNAVLVFDMHLVAVHKA